MTSPPTVPPTFPIGVMPLPAVTEDTRPFWDACRRRELVVHGVGLDVLAVVVDDRLAEVEPGQALRHTS